MSTWEELGEQVYRGITGDSSPRQETPGALLGWVRQFANAGNAARATGIPARTLRRWISNGLPKRRADRDAAVRRLGEAKSARARTRVLSKAREQKIRAGGMRADFAQQTDPVRNRSLTSGMPNVRWSGNGGVLDAFLGGASLADLGRKFVQSIGDERYRALVNPTPDDYGIEEFDDYYDEDDGYDDYSWTAGAVSFG